MGSIPRPLGIVRRRSNELGWAKGKRRQDPLGSHRQLKQARSGGVENGVGNHRPHDADRRLAAALRGSFGIFHENGLDPGSQEKRGMR